MSTIPTLFHRGLGARPDKPDARDRAFVPRPRTQAALPASVDLRAQCPPVYDQGRINSCISNVMAAAVAFSREKNGQGGALAPSRLFLYYNERVLQNEVANDVGASMRDGIRTLVASGVAPEALWPYDDTPATTPGGAFPPDSLPVRKPPQSAYDIAVMFEVLSYRRLRNELSQMRGCLAEGYPFALTLEVYPSFLSAPQTQATVTPLPGADEQSVGRHAVLAVGYDDAKQWLICRNSWGPAQADGGYFYLPYAYRDAPRRIGDLWSIRTVEH